MIRCKICWNVTKLNWLEQMQYAESWNLLVTDVDIKVVNWLHCLRTRVQTSTSNFAHFEQEDEPIVG